MAFLRISTHPGIFSKPLLPRKALDNVQSLLKLPQVRTLSEGERFWECYNEICQGVVVRGNLTPDAHIAALLYEHDVKTFYSNDSDFKKFGTLQLHNPFQ